VDIARARWVARQLRRVESFRLRARETGRYVAFSDIAHWCAVADGSLRQDQDKWIAAYRALVRDAADGWFDRGGISHVHVFNPEYKFGRLAGKGLRQVATDLDGDPIGTVVGVLQWCWLPTDMAVRFFARWNQPLPPELRRAEARHPKITASLAAEPGIDAVPLNAQVSAGSQSGDAAALVSDRTGAQGRPSSRHLVEEEFQRRNSNNETLPTLNAEAEALSGWLVLKHPGLAPMAPKTVANCIRAEYQARKKATK
jgi:hypothetical protein